MCHIKEVVYIQGNERNANKIVENSPIYIHTRELEIESMKYL